ncbi:SCO6880 family protein [Rhodococcus sp. MEB064]|uniref:SCO6880 family protein n=1 Tax=Rhodococcus sp. MEB064 TaxID=1587522 RepID=UPI000697FA31|nr:SCO6880 family protein [Rhodococcus sp. MEB064]
MTAPTFSSTAAVHEEPAIYSAGTRPKSTFAFGLSNKVIAYAGGFFALAFAVLIWGNAPAGFALMSLGAVLLVPLAIAPGGRSLYEKGHLRMQFFRSRVSRSAEYHAGPHSSIPGGRYRLPGWLAHTTLYVGIDRHGNEFGMIHHPKKQRYTVVVDCLPGGDEAVARGEKDLYTAEWGVYLADLGLPGDIVGAEVVVENIPATGLRLSRLVEREVVPYAPELSTAFVRQSSVRMPSGRHRTLARLSITFRATTKERQNDPEEMAAELARRLPDLYGNLAGAGIDAQPMTAAEITAAVHRSYNPSTENDFEELDIAGLDHGVAWEDAGPGRASSVWGQYRHDGVVSVVYEMAAPPESVFTDTVLKPLLQPHDDLLRKRLTLIYRPFSAGDAAKKVEKQHRDALHAINSRGAKISSAEAEKRLEITSQTRKEMVAGAGQLRYSALVTITVADPADVANAAAVIESLAARARLGLRRAHGFQDAAFAAGLGVGFLLPDHVTTSALVRHS